MIATDLDNSNKRSAGVDLQGVFQPPDAGRVRAKSYEGPNRLAGGADRGEPEDGQGRSPGRPRALDRCSPRGAKGTRSATGATVRKYPCSDRDRPCAGLGRPMLFIGWNCPGFWGERAKRCGRAICSRLGSIKDALRKGIGGESAAAATAVASNAGRPIVTGSIPI